MWSRTSPGTLFASTRISRFRRLLAALATSQLGDWIYNFALLAFVYERTESGTWLVATMAARLVPLLLLGPVGGIVADRWNRRRVMIISDASRAALMLALAVVAATELPLVLVPLLAALASAAGTPHTPSVIASTPRLVPAAQLTEANALRAGIRQVCISAGPALGAIALLSGSYASAFAFNALTFALATAILASIPDGPSFAAPGSGSAPRALHREILVGAAAIARSPVAKTFVVTDVICSAIYGAQKVLLLLVAYELGEGAGGFGWLLAAVGLGGVLGAGVVGTGVRLVGTRAVSLLALAVVAGTMIALAFASSLLLALALCCLCGGGLVIAEILAATGLQHCLGDRLLARASGFSEPAAVTGILLGSVLAPALVGALGTAGALAAFGGAIAIYAAALAGRAAASLHIPQPASAV